MKPMSYFSLIVLFLSCAKSTNINQNANIQLSFINEYIVPDSLFIDDTPIGGLSGIDYANNLFYMVVDDPINPRYLKATIDFKNDQISNINFNNVVLFKDTVSNFGKENSLDLEGIFVDENTQEIFFISEGHIKSKKNPSIFSTDSLGYFNQSFGVPTMFNANSPNKPKNNASFEGLSKSVDGKGFWVAMEGPLQSDGEHPSLKKTSSPIRVTYFDISSKKATKQFAYPLENITNPAKGSVNLNGVTAILEYAKNKFLIMERTYQSGYGMDGNIIRIFNVLFDENVTNTLEINSLKETEYKLVKKELLLDLSTIKNQLKFKVVDNLEGIAIGPTLSNGHKSILLVADNNFQKYGQQLNQFLLLDFKNLP